MNVLATTSPQKKQTAEEYLEKQAANAAFWTDQALQHGGNIEATASTRFIRAATLNRLRKFIPPDSVVLEIGCGNASSLLAPVSRNSRAYGIELNMQMLLAANRHTDIKGLIRSEACSLPFADASFDVVYTSRCLINVLDEDMQRMAIREVLRVAKPDATVVLVENFEQPVQRLNRIKKRLYAGAPDSDEHNLLMHLPRTLEYSEQLGWRPVWIRGNTLGSFVAHLLVAGITRQRGATIVDTLLHPLYVTLTWIENHFGKRLPLFGKDTMIVLKRNRADETMTTAQNAA